LIRLISEPRDLAVISIYINRVPEHLVPDEQGAGGRRAPPIRSVYVGARLATGARAALWPQDGRLSGDKKTAPSSGCRLTAGHRRWVDQLRPASRPDGQGCRLSKLTAFNERPATIATSVDP